MMQRQLHSFPKILTAFAMVSLFSVSNALAGAGETEDKKPKNASQKSIISSRMVHVQTDSLKQSSKKEVLSDSTIVKTKQAAPASYNILFQVIYRNSFSEIFEEGK